MVPRAPVLAVVAQHAEDLASLWRVRRRLVRAGHVALRHLERFDERIAAHADGIAVNGAAGLAAVRAALERADDGNVFAATLGALNQADAKLLEGCFDLAVTLPDVRPGAVSALGWVSAQRLTGIVRNLLASTSAPSRSLGLAACRLHGVDPGHPLDAALEDPDDQLRATAWRVAADLGRVDPGGRITGALADPAPSCRLWAATLAVRSGASRQAIPVLVDLAAAPGPVGRLASQRAALAQPVAAAREWLRPLANDPQQLRSLIDGVALVGDPVAIPWLIEHARNDRVARAAGAAFAMITGADLAALDLDRKPPAEVPDEPNDDSNDENVALSPDDGLPWPDAERLKTWWSATGRRFAVGVRHLCGAPVDAATCTRVLADGFQNHRRIAAEHRCLTVPGARWFHTAAPSWRQQRWLATERAAAQSAPVPGG